MCTFLKEELPFDVVTAHTWKALLKHQSSQRPNAVYGFGEIFQTKFDGEMLVWTMQTSLNQKRYEITIDSKVIVKSIKDPDDHF